MTLAFTYFYFLATLHGMWDLSTPMMGRPAAPAVEAQNLNHWTTREVAVLYLF